MEQERRWEQLQTSLLLLMMEGKARVEDASSRARIEGATNGAEITAVLNWMDEEKQ